MTNKKTRPGRPSKSSDKLKSESVLIRLEVAEKVGFQAAADVAGVPLSVWIRERLRWAATKELQVAGRAIPFLKLKAE